MKLNVKKMKLKKTLTKIFGMAALALMIFACGQDAGAAYDSPNSNSEQTAQISSVYTDITEKNCKTIEAFSDEGGGYIGECPGVGGYKLEILEGDLRQSINVIAPSGKKSELNLWSNVSTAFSTLGEKAEWRVTGKGKTARPLALIVRFNAAQNPEKPEKKTSYLVVAKITGETACLTDIVDPSKNANVEARRLADASAVKPCLGDRSEHAGESSGEETFSEASELEKQEIFRLIKSDGQISEFLKDLSEDAEKLARSLSVGKTDLNSDGQPEFIAVMEEGVLCGALANCPHWIYSKKDGNGYILLRQARARTIKLEKTSTSGYRDLRAEGGNTATTNTYVIFKFDGGKYQPSKCVMRDESQKNAKESARDCRDFGEEIQ